MPSLTARIAAGLAACSTALFLSSCGNSPSDGHAHAPRGEDPVISGEPAAYNSADVTFANTLTPHEEQGVDISRLAPDHSGNSDLVTFAVKTAAALEVDTQVLKALRVQWKEGQDKPTEGGPGTTTWSLIDSATVDRLNSLHGPEFDTLWLNSMISLDQGAIAAANAEIANGKNTDTISLAKQIAKARQTEIGQMQQMLPG